jgi:hypothetical protein
MASEGAKGLADDEPLPGQSHGGDLADASAHCAHPLGEPAREGA